MADAVPGPDGTTFRVLGPGVDAPAGVPLPGSFNVTNALAAIAACAEAGLDAAAVAAGIAGGGGVPGRFERIDAGQPFTVVVDYAHKPDAVQAALDSLRPLTTGRLIVVIGAGGDRDPGKRPLMGEIAARLADLVVVTDDNPRTEDPAEIRAAVLAGARGVAAEVSAQVLEEGDRRAAIALALDRARPGDIVVVAGKGHETGQEVDGVVHPFDDRAVVRDLLWGARTSPAEVSSAGRFGLRSGMRNHGSAVRVPQSQRSRGRHESHPAERCDRTVHLPDGDPRRDQPVPAARPRPADPRRRPDQPPHQDGHAHDGRGRDRPRDGGRPTSRPTWSR